MLSTMCTIEKPYEDKIQAFHQDYTVNPNSVMMH